ncbi:hypothetical protein ACLB1R_08335 [Escherichia coli]
MMKVDAVKRGTFDLQIPIAVRQQWRGAMECNGNGSNASTLMPESDVSVDEDHRATGFIHRKGAQRWCVNGCVCWRIAALIHSNWNKNCLNPVSACGR